MGEMLSGLRFKLWLTVLTVALVLLFVNHPSGIFTASRPPDVILVMIDTLRADRLHCYGNPRETSPNIDALADEGVFFDAAYAHSSWTLPSHTALMTSQYPGRYFKGCTKHQVSLVYFQIPETETTLASVLRDSGYDTVSFNEGAFVADWTGLDTGFRIYESFPGSDEKLKMIDTTYPEAEKYIRGDPEKPFFLFLHTYECHGDYTHGSTFCSDPPPGFDALRTKEHQLNHDPAWSPTEEQVAEYRALYDGGVRYVDQALERIIDALKETSRYDNSLIIITSDHGEELWDRGCVLHGHTFFDELLRVPLIIKFPNNEFMGRRVENLVRLVDLFPTVLDVCRVPFPAREIEGRSLLPCIEGREPDERWLYAAFMLNGPMRYCLRTTEHKYIYAPSPDLSFGEDVNIEVPEVALYHLKNDPGERNNIAARKPKLVAQLEFMLDESRLQDKPIGLITNDNAMGRTTAEMLPLLGIDPSLFSWEHDNVPEIESQDNMGGFLSEETLKQLRGLGYLGGQASRKNPRAATEKADTKSETGN